MATGASLDREVDIVRTVVVRASDDGTPQLHADKTVAITLSNVNEVPEFDAATAIRTVPENSAGDTNVGAPVEATDPDVGDTLTYTDDSDVFNVVNTSGQLQVHQNGASLDYEGTNSYTVTVTVNDAAGLSDSIVVTVNLTNVNEPPSFDAGGAATLSVAENSAAVTPVGAPLGVTDVDAGDSTTYTDNSARFNISSSGQVHVASGADLDYESSDHHTFTATVADGGGLTDTISVRVNLTDANDPPEFADETVTFSVAENSAAGTNVGEPLTVTDMDVGDTVAYSDNSALFDVTSSGQVQVATGAILDHELDASITFTVTATDGGSPGLTDTVQVTVTVTDMDERPQLDPDPTGVSYEEGSNPGVVVHQPWPAFKASP